MGDLRGLPARLELDPSDDPPSSAPPFGITPTALDDTRIRPSTTRSGSGGGEEGNGGARLGGAEVIDEVVVGSGQGEEGGKRELALCQSQSSDRTLGRAKQRQQSSPTDTQGFRTRSRWW